MNDRNITRRFFNGLLQSVFVLWAFLLVFYFEYREGLIRWKWLVQPETGGFFRDKGMPDPRLLPAPSSDMPEAPYFIILKNLFLPCNIHWGNIPLAEIVIAFLMVVALTGLGWLYVRWTNTVFSRLAELCVSFVMGCGIVGIGVELAGMAGQLNRGGVLTVWGVLAVLGAWGYFRRPNKGEETVTCYDDTKSPAGTVAQTVLFYGMISVFSIISFLVFLHAVGEPIVYWDSLILYAGYARDMYLQHGFPLKTVGQVGVGLGANYPHLFPVLSAQTAAIAGYWHDMFAQVIPPVASLVSLLTVYVLVKEMTGARLIAAAVALLIRSIPYGIAYGQYASDYALAICFTSVFIYLAWRTIRDGASGYRNLMFFTAAAACHINYLMLALWGVAAWAVVLAYWNRKGKILNEDENAGEIVRDFSYRENLKDVLLSGKFWLRAIGIFLLSTPWYIRNVWYTGNPVYAFYYNIFPSIHVNPKVMKSAEIEWLLNGDGLGRVGHTLGEKLRGSWEYFVTGGQHWKLAPVFMGFVLPGMAAWLIQRGRMTGAGRNDDVSAAGRFTFAVTTLFLLLWYYAYAVADFYLYQIIIILPLFSVYLAWLFMLCRGRIARRVLFGLTLFVGVFPGIAMGLMGFKLKNTGVYRGMPAPQFNLTALRQLFMDKNVYYRMEFGGDMEMIGKINALPDGTKILTHENRHLLLNPKNPIVHLDDWEMQGAYDKPLSERVAILDKENIRYYMYMTNEDKHIANSWLGMGEIIKAGYFEPVYETPSSGGSMDEYPHEVIPRDKNVLYKRTDKKP